MKKHSLSVLTLLVLSTTSVYAENNTVQQDSALNAVEVKASSGETTTEHNKSLTTSAMSTTTGLVLSPRQTPQSVSVITNTQLSEQGITSMEQALRNTTGVNVVKDSGKYRFQSRGFYINKIEEDGLATSVLGGNSGNPYRDAQSMTDLAIYDHIEVVRGATGLTQGVGEPGGTINAVRKKPTAQTQASVETSVDRFGALRAVGDVSGSLNQSQTISGRLVAVGERERTAQDDVKNNKGTIYGVLDFVLNDYNKFTIGGLYQDQKEVPDYWGIPMAVGGGNAGFSRDTYLGYNWNELRTKKTNVFTEFDHYFNDDWKLTNKISYTKNQSDSQLAGIYNSSTSYQGYTSGSTLATQNIQKYENDGKQFVVNTNLNGKYSLFGRQHEVFWGHNYSYERTDTTWKRARNSTAFNPFEFQGNELNAPDWNSVSSNGGYADRTFYDSRIISNAITAGTKFQATDDLALILGTRYENYRSVGNTNYDTWSYVPDTDADIHSKVRRVRFIPYFGATYDINNNHSIYASYTSIFKPQTATDAEGKILDPIVGTNMELGWKSEFYDGKLNTALSVFRIEQENRAVTISAANSHTGRAYSVPTGLIRSRGVDAEISGDLTERWKLFAGYTFNISEYRRAESNTYTQGMEFSKHTPKHLFRLYTSYNLPIDDNKWTIGVGVNAQTAASSIYNVSQGGYALWSANIQYAATPNIKLSLIGDNLTNKLYYENHRVRTLGINNHYGEGRNVTFKFSWNY
ncbi:TonB-dependent siderophore receptor [Lonepinella sp. MS14435]|uniref:TonB-dependent siderophore receptor n=1 Tax=Lonepinella sp. MS14435 TaxID=3003618 RepID=UPI0036D9AA53